MSIKIRVTYLCYEFYYGELCDMYCKGSKYATCNKNGYLSCKRGLRYNI